MELILLLALSLKSPEDESLSAAIRAGDRTAFRAFFDSNHTDLLSYLRHRGVDADVAEDLVQNAFIHIWEHRQEIEPSRSLRGFLFRIAYTRALNHFRDTRKFTGTDPASMELGAYSDPAEGRDIREQVSRAVAALPERRRAVFELCVLQGLSYREAAEALEITPKTVENHMGYALKAVREQLQDLRA